jgi:hypothetical protein
MLRLCRLSERANGAGMKFLVTFGVVLVALTGAAAAQSQAFKATASNNDGGKFALSIRQDGSRLRFDLSASGATSSIGGLPNCEAVNLQQDGSFSTYCKGFLTGDSRRYQLQGNLQQGVAKLDNVPRLCVTPTHYNCSRHNYRGRYDRLLDI